MSSPSPLRSAASGLVLLLLFLLSWQLFAWLIGLTAAFMLLCRYVDWSRARPTLAGQALTEWGPFLAILLTVYFINK